MSIEHKPKIESAVTTVIFGAAGKYPSPSPVIPVNKALPPIDARIEEVKKESLVSPDISFPRETRDK
jgi:hypothetical protein